MYIYQFLLEEDNIAIAAELHVNKSGGPKVVTTKISNGPPLFW